MTVYRDDLAYVHDAGYGDFARSAARGILSLLDRAGIHEGLVVDLGCGSGILAQALDAEGFEVLGIDLSAPMLRLARRRVPRARFRRGSLFSARLPRCRAVTIVGECLNYLFDRRNSSSLRRGLFERTYEALEPGGILACDFLEPGQVPPPGIARRFREGPDWATLVEASEDPATARLTRRITTFRRVGRLWRRQHEIHGVQLLDAGAVAAQLREAGFRVARRRGYGTEPAGRRHAVLVARKPPR